jgi:hypothetical protein
LFNDPKGQPFWIFGVRESIVKCPSAQFVPEGSNQQMNGSFFGTDGIGIFGVVIMGALVRRRTDCFGDILLTCFGVNGKKTNVSSVF